MPNTSFQSFFFSSSNPARTNTRRDLALRSRTNYYTFAMDNTLTTYIRRETVASFGFDIFSVFFFNVSISLKLSSWKTIPTFYTTKKFINFSKYVILIVEYQILSQFLVCSTHWIFFHWKNRVNELMILYPTIFK